MNPMYLFGAAVTLAGIGMVVVTSYLFALGWRSDDQRFVRLVSLTGVAFAVVGTAVAFMAFSLTYSASPLPRENPIGGLSTIVWVVVWFALVLILTYDPESLWKHRLESLK